MCEVWKSNANGCEKQRQLSPRSVKTWSCESHLRHNVEAKIPTPHQRSHTLENVGTFWLHHRDESHQAIRDRPNAAHYLHIRVHDDVGGVDHWRGEPARSFLHPNPTRYAEHSDTEDSHEEAVVCKSRPVFRDVRWLISACLYFVQVQYGEKLESECQAAKSHTRHQISHVERNFLSKLGRPSIGGRDRGGGVVPKVENRPCDGVDNEDIPSERQCQDCTPKAEH
mmetsp:Transcript_21605/g.34872  ORF Transcript_21605/g.34872 Transcript_21605/m.34872 type:complete len:225 (-) Transcript_21605:341-1015(-)